MGYYADAEGYIKFKEEPSREIDKVIKSLLAVTYDKSERVYNIGEYDRYDEQNYYDVFAETHGLVEAGEIEFRGDDGILWRFIYIPEKGAWDEQLGRIVYNE